MTDTDRRMKAANNRAVRERNYRRARERALTKLAQAHPDEYKILLQREKASDETQGRKWIDITGATRSMDSRSLATVNAQAGSDNQGENKGNYGGEA